MSGFSQQAVTPPPPEERDLIVINNSSASAVGNFFANGTTLGMTVYVDYSGSVAANTEITFYFLGLIKT